MGTTAFFDLMTDTVQIEPAAGRDLYGAAVFGPVASFRARIIYRSRVSRSTVAEVNVPKGVVWLAGTPALTLDDRVTLPDGTQPTILSVEVPTDPAGPHHTKITFGWSGPNANPR
jgi:hypothetical protein